MTANQADNWKELPTEEIPASSLPPTKENL
ncbi:hypothetical protein MiSe_71610 [Microseira wollei NIES-4236]|uniref:Uncharacterized protein n=1 Tax=Microseira wollei NIES-4236 TaxID=2530354 RepID=A0AAV3XMQ2_9CYAN|nr:hypothetical protein MiSe_71610 [Microseira wollei NIES-4236]